MYNQMLINLKDAAFHNGLVLNPKVIAVYFEQAAISAFRLHFPSAKLIGCHFHFCHAIYGWMMGEKGESSFERWMEVHQIQAESFLIDLRSKAMAMANSHRVYVMFILKNEII